MAKRRRYTDEQLTGPAPAPESVLKKAGRAAVGGISAVANVLDVPGSMVRDVLGGHNPFDQLLTPHRSDNRLTGRDLSRQYGFAQRNDTWANFGGGLGVEVATDPLTYLTFGGSALGKFGKAARAAGIHGDEAARIFNLAKGVAPGTYGKRAARLGLTGSMIKQHAPEAFQKIQGAANLPMDEALGGLATFWPTGTVLGAGAKAQKVAGAMDVVGNTIRHAKIPGTTVRPVGDIMNLFNKRSLGATSQSQYQFAGKLLGDREASIAKVRQASAHIALERKKAGIGAGQFENWLDYPQNAPAYAQPLVQEAHALYKDLPAEFREWGGVLPDVSKQMKFAGSDVAYKPRAFAEHLTPTHQAQTKATSGFTRASMPRADWTKGVVGGDAVLKEMAKYVGQLRQSGIVDVKDIATELEAKFGANFHPTYLPGKQYQALAKSKKAAKKFPTLMDLEAHLATLPPNKALKIGGVKMAPQDTFQDAAKWLSGMTDEALQHGVWGNDPLVDITQSTVQSRQALDSIKNVVTYLADSYKKGAPIFNGGPGSVPLGELLTGSKLKKVRGLGFTMGDRHGGLAKKFIELASGTNISTLKKKDAARMIKAIKNLPVDGQTATFLRQMNDQFTSPETVNAMAKIWDKITNFTKSMFTTADFIRFNARNFPGGQFNNLTAGQASSEGTKAALDLVTKGTIQGATDIPIVKQIAAQRGIQQVDDQVATQILQELAYAHEITAHAGTGNPTHAQHIGGSMEDILSEVPGERKFTLSGLGQTLKGQPGAWNPFGEKFRTIRGVSGEETLNPWIKAGEQVGDFTEHMIRFPAFYALLKQGVDPAEAARMVGEAQVRYQNRFYTKFEQQVMQRLMLFYKFFRGQVPFTLKLLSEQPGGRLAQTLRTINRSREEEELVPDWIKETASIPLGQAEDGTKRYITGLGLPFEDPIQFATPTFQNILLEGASRLNPAIKGPLEYMTGQSFFQKGGPHGGRPLEDLDPVLGRTLANIGELTGLRQSKAPVRYPGSDLVEHVLSNSPVSPFLTKARTLTDPRKSVPTRLSNILTGVKQTDVSPASQDRELRRRVQRIEKALGAKTFTETYLPKDVLAELSPVEAQQAAQLSALKKLLDERSKSRKK